MATLLLRFRAPMMSWGDHSRFTIRDTRREPTKSAVIGLLCAALGRPRHEPIHDLASLSMGVRVNQEGLVDCDYHTIENSIKSSGSHGSTVISHRYYIADADYLIGLEGERSQLELLDKSLESPCWQLYFGRKSFVPSLPVRIPYGVVDLPLETALKKHSCLMSNKQQKRLKKQKELRYVIETENSLDIRQDVPIDWERRLFGSRCVKTSFHPVEVET